MSEKENEIDGVEIASETLLGDLMKLVVDEIKVLPKVWQELSQSKQDDVIERVEKRVREAVMICVELIAANGRSTIPATLEQVTVKDGIKGVVTVSKVDPKRHELTDAVGRAVLIVVADAADHLGGAGQVTSDPDQPELPIDEADLEAAYQEAQGEVDRLTADPDEAEVVQDEKEDQEALELEAAAIEESPTLGTGDSADLTDDEMIARMKDRGYEMTLDQLRELSDADYFAAMKWLQDGGVMPHVMFQYVARRA